MTADPASPRSSGPGEIEGAPRTGDVVIDAALGELAETPAEDLDAALTHGETIHRTLRARLGDLDD